MRVLLATDGSHLTSSPPLGLLSLAAALRAQGSGVEVHDLTVHPDRRDSFVQRCSDPDVLWVGFSAATPNLPTVERLASRVRGRKPDLPLILGGVHATAMPRQTLVDGPWDAVCVGEGERVATQVTSRLLSGEDLAGIGGLLTRADPDALVRPEVIEDLTTLPLPAWDLIDLRDYQARPWQLVRRGRRIAPILTSRGCPFNCSFCAVHVVAQRKIRRRSVEQILQEAEILTSSYGADELQILDDAFNADLDHAKEVLSGILSRGIKVPWKTPNGIRVDLWDKEFIKLAVESGCYQVGFGLESADPAVLAANDKKLDPEQAKETILAWERAGISTFGFFIVGLSGETASSAARTRRYAAASALSHAHASFAIPYPGTKLWSQLRGKLNVPWEGYRHTEPFPTCDMSATELRRSVRAFYLRFYASPRRSTNLLRESIRTGPLAFARTGWAYFVGGDRKE